jgi:hypothetical protein
MTSAETDATLYTQVWFRGSAFADVCESASEWLREHEDSITVVHIRTNVTDDFDAAFEMAILYAP